LIQAHHFTFIRDMYPNFAKDLHHSSFWEIQILYPTICVLFYAPSVDSILIYFNFSSDHRVSAAVDVTETSTIFALGILLSNFIKKNSYPLWCMLKIHFLLKKTSF